jgi:hypothetical protein
MAESATNREAHGRAAVAAKSVLTGKDSRSPKSAFAGEGESGSEKVGQRLTKQNAPNRNQSWECLNKEDFFISGPRAKDSSNGNTN